MIWRGVVLAAAIGGLAVFAPVDVPDPAFACCDNPADHCDCFVPSEIRNATE